MSQSAKSSRKTKKHKQKTRPSTANLVVPVRTIRGRGNFYTGVKDFFTKDRGGGSIINHGFQRAGRYLGDTIAPGLGTYGAKAGSWMSKIMGLGKYKVRSNSLMRRNQVENMPYVSRPPEFNTTSTGSDVEIVHQELVQDVMSSTTFNSTVFINNPGNPLAFPWLSQLAQFYELFEWQGLVYQYKSTSSMATNTASGSMGTICIATDYDCSDNAFTSKRQMENTEYASNSAPYTTFLHPIECDPKRSVGTGLSYVVAGATTVAEASGATLGGITMDPRLNVPSVTTIAAVGNTTDNQPLGELWVSYHIKLSRPLLANLNTPSTKPWVQEAVFDNAGNLLNSFANQTEVFNLALSTSLFIQNTTFASLAPRSFMINVQAVSSVTMTSPTSEFGKVNWLYVNTPDGAQITNYALDVSGQEMVASAAVSVIGSAGYLQIVLPSEYTSAGSLLRVIITEMPRGPNLSSARAKSASVSVKALPSSHSSSSAAIVVASKDELKPEDEIPSCSVSDDDEEETPMGHTKEELEAFLAYKRSHADRFHLGKYNPSPSPQK